MRGREARATRKWGEKQLTRLEDEGAGDIHVPTIA